MPKLILEEIAKRDNPEHLELDLQKPVQIARPDGRERIMNFQGTKFSDVYISDQDYALWLLIGGRMPNLQGHFKIQNGQVIYDNDCIHGTLILPANSKSFVLEGADPHRGTYDAHIGDRFVMGFPRSRHVYQIILSK